jgi:hypothetical protein
MRPLMRRRIDRVEPIFAPFLEPSGEATITPSRAPPREEPRSVTSSSTSVDDAAIVRTVRTKLQERHDLLHDRVPRERESHLIRGSAPARTLVALASSQAVSD